MKTLALVLSVVILSEHAYSQQFRRNRVRSEPQFKNLEVQNLTVNDTGASTSPDIVEVESFSLQQYIMRGRGPRYRGTKINVTQNQILSIKVDFSRNDYSWLFSPTGNAAFMYQTYIYQVKSPEYTNQLSAFRTSVIDAFTLYGRESQQARDALDSGRYRGYLPNRYSVYVSNEKGALRNDATCISGGDRTDFNFQQRAPRAAHPGDCADVRPDKVWYINITLNHCDYEESFKDPETGRYVTVRDSDRGQCKAEFSLYQDLLYFN